MNHISILHDGYYIGYHGATTKQIENAEKEIHLLNNLTKLDREKDQEMANIFRDSTYLLNALKNSTTLLNSIKKVDDENINDIFYFNQSLLNLIKTFEGDPDLDANLKNLIFKVKLASCRLEVESAVYSIKEKKLKLWDSSSGFGERVCHILTKCNEFVKSRTDLIRNNEGLENYNYRNYDRLFYQEERSVDSLKKLVDIAISEEGIPEDKKAKIMASFKEIKTSMSAIADLAKRQTLQLEKARLRPQQ